MSPRGLWRTCDVVTAIVFEWHKCFNNGHEEVEDDPNSGQPSMTKMAENTNRVNQMVRRKRRLCADDSEGIHPDRKSMWIILVQELGMQRMCAIMVPKLLPDDQKEHQVSVCQKLLEKIGEDKELIGQLVTGDETWVFQYNLETKRQSLQCKTPTSPRLKKASCPKQK